jgi:hypothetical protein
MTKKYYCERVDQGFIDNAPFRNTVDLAITPEQVFEVLADAESWPQWVTVITKVTCAPAAGRPSHAPVGAPPAIRASDCRPQLPQRAPRPSRLRRPENR